MGVAMETLDNCWAMVGPMCQIAPAFKKEECLTSVCEQQTGCH